MSSSPRAASKGHRLRRFVVISTEHPLSFEALLHSRRRLMKPAILYSGAIIPLWPINGGARTYTRRPLAGRTAQILCRDPSRVRSLQAAQYQAVRLIG